MTNVSAEAEQHGIDENAVDELARERRYDAAALRISERVRSSLNLHEVLQQTLNELGPATDVSRSIIQLAPNHSGVSLMFEWDRGDTRPLGLRPPTVVACRVFSTGQPVIVDDVNECEDEDVAAYLRQVNSAAAI